MKISKLASAVFAVVGTVLLLSSIGVSFFALSKPTKAVKPAQGANDCAQEMLNALDSGDLAGAAAFFYGTPDLGLNREPETAEGQALWNAYRGSIEVTTDGGCYGEGTNIFQTAQVTHIDIPQTLAGLDRRAEALLKAELEAEEDPADALGEDGQIPQAQKDELRTAAFEAALEDPKTVTAQITFQLIEEDGQWWILPDQALLDILAGGLK